MSWSFQNLRNWAAKFSFCLRLRLKTVGSRCRLSFPPPQPADKSHIFLVVDNLIYGSGSHPNNENKADRQQLQQANNKTIKNANPGWKFFSQIKKREQHCRFSILQYCQCGQCSNNLQLIPYFFLREKLSSHDVGTRCRKSLLNSEIKKWNKVKVKDHYFSWLKVKLIWTFSSHENLHICTFEYRYQFGSAEIPVFDKKNLRNVFETTESDSAVSMTTRN